MIQNSRFFKKIFKISQIQDLSYFFYLNCQIQGLSRFPGKVATLYILILIQDRKRKSYIQGLFYKKII